VGNLVNVRPVDIAYQPSERRCRGRDQKEIFCHILMLQAHGAIIFAWTTAATIFFSCKHFLNCCSNVCSSLCIAAIFDAWYGSLILLSQQVAATFVWKCSTYCITTYCQSAIYFSCCDVETFFYSTPYLVDVNYASFTLSHCLFNLWSEYAVLASLQ